MVRRKLQKLMRLPGWREASLLRLLHGFWVWKILTHANRHFWLRHARTTRLRSNTRPSIFELILRCCIDAI